MVLTPEQKRENKRIRMLEKATEYRTQTYLARFVTRDFQQMIRAESGATVEFARCIIDGKIDVVHSPLGKCVCVTCGAIHPWSGTNLMDTGHFLASRRNSIVLEETNVAPQCHACNFDSGRPETFKLWMLAVRGQEVIDELYRLKSQVSRSFDRFELVELRLSYLDRIKAAKDKMKRG